MSANEPQQPADSRNPNGTRFPDPSILTTEQLIRAIESEREWTVSQLDVLRERLLGIDRATELRFVGERGGIQDIPNQIKEKVGHLSALTEGRFDSIKQQFMERDTRAERESRDNKVAVDAAFAASKEASSEQNKSNTLAITKSEIATTETINKLAELFHTSTGALGGKIDDLKTRVSRVEDIRQGATEFRTEARAGISSATAVIGAIVAVVVIVTTLYALRPKVPDPVVVTPPTVTVTVPAK